MNYAIFFEKKCTCNIDSYWQRGDFAARQKLQKMLFPVPICYDKGTGDYRTSEVNALAEVIRDITTGYGDGKTKSDCDFHHQSLVVETLSGLSNKYVKDYQAIVRFIDDNIPSLNGFG